MLAINHWRVGIGRAQPDDARVPETDAGQAPIDLAREVRVGAAWGPGGPGFRASRYRWMAI